MAISNHAKSDALKAFILNNDKAIEFFQLLRLFLLYLRMRLHESDIPDSEIPSWDKLFEKCLRIRPSLSMGFPENEVRNIKFIDNFRIEIETTFFGLYGVTSPLPNFYSEDLIANAQYGSSNARHFLDVFHYSSYLLLIQAMTRYRYLSGLQIGQDQDQLDRYLCFIGIEGNEFRNTYDEWPKLLKLAPILSIYGCSAYGLKKMLEVIIRSGTVKVNPNPTISKRIADKFRLSLGKRNHILGKQAIVGSHILDRRNSVEIVLEGQQDVDIEGIVPGGEHYQFLKQAIKLYTPRYLKINFRVKGTSKSVKLNQRALGYGAALGGTPRNDEFIFSL